MVAVRVLIFTLLIFVLTPTFVFADAKQVNPYNSMDIRQSSTNTRLQGYTLYTSGSATGTVVNDVYFSSNASYRITNAANSYFSFYTNTYAADPVDEYFVRAKVKPTASGGKTLNLSLVFTDVNSVTLATYSTVINMTSVDWQSFEVRSKAPDKTKYVFASVNGYYSDLYLDDIEIWMDKKTDTNTLLSSININMYWMSFGLITFLGAFILISFWIGWRSAK